MDKPTSLFITHLRLLAALWLVMATTAVGLAQNGPIESGSGEFVPEIPASYSGSGSFFNRQLGTAFRFSYHNEGYGTQDGVVTLGTMKVFNQQGSTIFLDGQATLSDGFGGGFNAGIGYRTLANLGFGPDPRRINGISFWADGQSTSADNFFSQLGVAAESLGDSFDLRFQGNFPLDRIKDGVRVDVLGASPMFEGDALMGDLQRFARDTALTVIDLEGAKRILDLEAWAFLGGYHLTGSGMDATGYRAGVRGYAVPDVSVSLQVTDDDIYHTNVVFGLTWFVGRTNRSNEPCGTLLDRFREPVLRNDYIATTQQIIDDPINPLSDAVSNEQFVFVHVDSDAPAGGDGTIENPYNTLAAAEAGSSEDNIVFVHSGYDLGGVAEQFATKDGQRVLGEGLDPNGIFIDHIVNSAEKGLVSLPESSPGSQGGTAPVITGMGTVFDLDNHTSNEINNFVINGGVTAVSANLAVSPQLANLDINSPTGDAISFVDVTGNSLIENSVTINGAGGKGILVDGGSGVLGANAMITNAVDYAVEIRNRTGGSMTVGQITDTGLGVFVHDNTGGSITFSSLVDLNTDANTAVQLSDNSGTTITFQELQATSSAGDTFVVEGGGTISVNDPNSSITNTGTGSALVVTGDNGAGTGDPSVTILADITNSGGDRAVDIQSMTGGSVSISGDVTDNSGAGSGILIENNTGGTFSFAGTTTLDTDGTSAVTLRNNLGATVTFSSLDATAAAGDTFVVEGGGTINVFDPNSSIANTGAGTAVHVRGDVNFDGDSTVNIAADVVNTVGGMSVDIQDMTGLAVIFGGLVNDMDGGVLIQNNTGGNFIFMDTLTVNTGNNDAVSLISNTGATLSFNGLDITSTGAVNKGFTATGGGDLLVTNANPTTITSEMDSALDIDGMTIDVGNVTFDTVTQTAGTSTGIILRDLDGTGSMTVDADTTTPGLITSLVDSVLIDGGTNNITVNTDITNSGGRSLEVIDRTGGTVLVNSEINDSGIGMRISDNTGGAVNITDALTFNTGANDAITISGNDGAAIDFTETSSIDLGTTSGSGVHLTGTETNVDIDADITGGTGTSVDVEGDATLTMDGNITSTAGRSVQVHNLTAGTVSIRGDVDDTGLGISIDNNTGGTVNLNGQVTLNTGANNALTIESNGSGNTVNFNASSQLDIDTTSGKGIVINGPGTVNINGTGNTIDTATDVGIAITNAENTTINNTTVNAAGSNGVEMDHTSATASRVTLNNVTVTSTGGNGVDILANGSGEFDVVMDNVNINTSSGGGLKGISFDTGASADRVDFTLTNSLIVSGDDNAFLATLGVSNTADVRFLIVDNQFSNNSAAAATVDILVSSGLTLSATIGNGPNDTNNPPTAPIGDRNRFVNSSGAGDAFLIEMNNAGGTINLDLRDNTAQAVGLQFDLTNTLGTFNLVDKDDTINDLNNQGAVTDNADVYNDILPPLLKPTP